VVSDVLREAVVEHGVPAERVLVNPNGVDVERLAPLRERSAPEWRSAAGRPEAPTVGFIGTFGPWHGVLLLPELVEAVATARPDARWILIGGGWLHDQVREEIERRGLADRVLLTGLIDHDEALRLLAATDVCISPHVPNPDGSRFFGSPTKLFEYMGLGKAIVASDLEQIGEVIEHERTGLLSPPGDVDAAAAAIGRLLDDADLRRRLGDAALDEARERYSWTAHTRRILDALAVQPDQRGQAPH
jgi:glycosyltransferase involved in cell wall biosynthesis